MPIIEKPVYTVSEVNRKLKRAVEYAPEFKNIRVKGQLSNVKYHYTGHIYFSIKDENCTLPGMMYRSNAAVGLNVPIEDGQEVIITGYIGVYERDGKVQIYAARITLAGEGILNQRFEQMKQTLEKRGWFDVEHKKEIPLYAARIGVIAARNSAALQDIVTTARARNPYVTLVFCHAKVQGLGAAESVAESIKKLDKQHLDVMIVARGGGSLEDLWAFNEEPVAKAIYEAETPVVTGVGHDVDLTIADYVADRRAITPTAAAELCVFDYKQFVSMLEQKKRLLLGLINRQYERRVEQLDHKKQILHRFEPGLVLSQTRQELLLYRKQLLQEMQKKVQRQRDANVRRREQLTRNIGQIYTIKRHALAVRTARLNGLSPTAKLIHGFGYVTKQGEAVSDVTALKTGDRITITMKTGEVNADIV